MTKKIHYLRAATGTVSVSNRAECAARVAGRRTYLVTSDQAQVDCSRCLRSVSSVSCLRSVSSVSGKVVDLMAALKESLQLK